MSNSEYALSAEIYDWGLGLGVTVSVLKNEKSMAMVRVVCDKSDRSYEHLDALPEAELVAKAFETVTARELAPRALELQDTVRKEGEEGIWPLYCSFDEVS